MCCQNFHKGQSQDSLELVNTSYGENGWCSCDGEDGLGCCGYATQPDGKCDRCRKHCQADEQFTPAELARAAGEFGSDAVERHVEVSAVS